MKKYDTVAIKDIILDLKHANRNRRCMVVSNREKVMEMIENIPESKLIIVIDILSNLVEEVEPDQWDLDMIEEAEKENDGSKITFDEILKRDGLTYADL